MTDQNQNQDNIPVDVAKLYADYYQLLTMYALNFVNTMPDAEDVVQDVFTACVADMRGTKQYQPNRERLYTAVRWRCLDVLKRRRVLTGIMTMPGPLRGVYHYKREYERFYEALDLIELDLSPLRPLELEIIFGYVYVHGYSTEEIAVCTGYTRAKVKTILYRARRRVAAHNELTTKP